MARGRIRYAVIGAGDIAQEAILPAFAQAENSELAAIVSGDPAKREELGRLYGVPTYPYDRYEECLSATGAGAVYITVPNHLHREYAMRAARAGVHVLCEKPMAVTVEDCEEMIRACQQAGVKLMTAYRLHFERGNLEAIRIASSGELGKARFFSSNFTQQVAEGNVRLAYSPDQGGGPVYDMGAYCINAARYLFRDEPVEVTAMIGNNGERRFRLAEEMASAILRFPGDRIATFTCSFGAVHVSAYELVGTEGRLQVDPAYDYSEPVKHRLTVGGRTAESTFEARDQFAPELIYFSGCILDDREPEPSGEEGLADVRVIRAIYESVHSGRPARLGPFTRTRRPDLGQEIYRPQIQPPKVMHAAPPSGERQ